MACPKNACTCNWFADYFKERMQNTRIGSVLSSGVPIEHGVYQGSPLGPLVFIICINDIINYEDYPVIYHF